MPAQDKALHFQQYKLHLHCKIERLDEVQAPDESATLKLSGQLPRNKSGGSIFPTTKELNDAFASRSAQHPIEIRVESIQMEENYNFIHLDPSSNNHLLKLREAYVTFGSPIQAEYVRSLGQPISIRIEHSTAMCTLHFERPIRSRAVRATYEAIGDLIQRLRRVDSNLRALGAVPLLGMPVLPDHYMQKEQFDDHANKCILKEDRQGLHSLLVYKVRIDREKRQEGLDALVEERIDVLLRLSGYDPDEFPFALERKFM